MDDQEKLHLLFDQAEEQQKLIEELIKQTQQQQQRIDELIAIIPKAVMQGLGEAKTEHEKITQGHKELLEALHQKARADWKIVNGTTLTTFLLCAVIIAGFSFYISHLTKRVIELTPIIEKGERAQRYVDQVNEKWDFLKRGNVDSRDDCSHPVTKKKDQICVRVMKSWGGQGRHNDYFVIDPLEPDYKP